MVEVRSGRSIGRKLSRGGSGLGRVANSGSSVGVMEQPWSIFSLTLVILLVKKIIMFSLLRSAGIEVSAELWLFMNLTMVLNRKCGLFLLSSIKDEE